MGADHFHTSAKLNRGIQELFNELTVKMLQKAEVGNKHSFNFLAAHTNESGSRTNTISLDEANGLNSAARSRANCCSGGGGGHDTVVTGIPVDNNLVADDGIR